MHHVDQGLIPLQLRNISIGTRIELLFPDTHRSMIPCHQTCKACQFITVITAPTPFQQQLHIFIANTTPFTSNKFPRLTRRRGIDTRLTPFKLD